MEINNISDYFKIAKNAEAVQSFFILIRKLTYFPEEFSSKDAAELIKIIDNEQENLKQMAEVFKKLGISVEVIPEENWTKLRALVSLYL